MSENFDQWAIVEVMGHTRYAGRVVEEEIAGAGFLRVMVPETERHEAFSKFLNPRTAVFGFTVVTEDVARRVAERDGAEPFELWALKASLLSDVAVDASEDEPPW